MASPRAWPKHVVILMMVSCHSTSGEAPPEPATFVACQTDQDCPQPERVCAACVDGTTICAGSVCGNAYGTIFEDGGWRAVSCRGASCPPQQCVDTPAWCPGAKNDPCAHKSCGDACQQCNTADGGCYQGTCTGRGVCNATVPDCSASPGQLLAAACSQTTDALGVGDCNYLFGWAWSPATGCSPVVGCSCQGSDCSHLFGFYCNELTACIAPDIDASCATRIPNTCFDAGAGRD